MTDLNPTDVMRQVEDIVYAGIPAYEASKDRVSWPTVGSYGTPDSGKLARYQQHDPSGREWVGVCEQPVRHVDFYDDWFGPVVEENDDFIVLDLGFGGGYRFATFAKSRCTVRRAA